MIWVPLRWRWSSKSTMERYRSFQVVFWSRNSSENPSFFVVACRGLEPWHGAVRFRGARCSHACWHPADVVLRANPTRNPLVTPKASCSEIWAHQPSLLKNGRPFGLLLPSSIRLREILSLWCLCLVRRLRMLSYYAIISTIRRQYTSMGKARRDSLAHTTRRKAKSLPLLSLRLSAATLGRDA